MINSEKKALRLKYKTIRSNVKDRALSDRLITESVLKSELYKNADRLYIYWSVASEVHTHNIISRALADGKLVALPRCEDTAGNMQFYYIASLADLSEGMYGITEPTSTFRADDYTADSLCIVPALSFDTNGYRLGYGKGYYDRFLSRFKGISMGLCYDECLSEALPYDDYDRKVNYIVTNTKIYEIR